MTTDPERNSDGLFRSRSGIVLIGFAIVAAFYLWTEHSAHLLGILPFLLFLACPLMHLFMHGGHGGHGGYGAHHNDGQPGDRADARGPEKQP